MDKEFFWKCECCGQVVSGSPSLAKLSPDEYAALNDEQRSARAKLSDDFCTITAADSTKWFIRGVLEIPIHGLPDPFLWGVWVELNESDYQHYRETFRHPIVGERLLGVLGNQIEGYPVKQVRNVEVVVAPDPARPRVLLRGDTDEDDLLYRHHVEGISWETTQEIVAFLMHLRDS